MTSKTKTKTLSHKPKPNDPLDINGRLYNQVGVLLDQLEKRDEDEDGIHITLKERIAALIAVGRIMTIFAGLRKKEPDDPDAGASVRKYAGAFKQDEAGRGAQGGRGRRQPKSEPDDWFEHAALDTGSDDDDREFDA